MHQKILQIMFPADAVYLVQHGELHLPGALHLFGDTVIPNGGFFCFRYRLCYFFCAQRFRFRGIHSRYLPQPAVFAPRWLRAIFPSAIPGIVRPTPIPYLRRADGFRVFKKFHVRAHCPEFLQILRPVRPVVIGGEMAVVMVPFPGIYFSGIGEVHRNNSVHAGNGSHDCSPLGIGNHGAPLFEMLYQFIREDSRYQIFAAALRIAQKIQMAYVEEVEHTGYVAYPIGLDGLYHLIVLARNGSRIAGDSRWAAGNSS